jgi:hypothetical protein
MKNILIIILLLISSVVYSQRNVNPNNCTYAATDITITLNGWDIDRVDYDHRAFLTATSLQQYNNFTFSGEKNTAEFGYPWYYYTLNDNRISFAGLIEAQNNQFLGKISLFDFDIKSGQELNVNGINIGDSTQEVLNIFNNICMDNENNALVVYYNCCSVLSFNYDVSTNLITSISYFTPL